MSDEFISIVTTQDQVKIYDYGGVEIFNMQSNALIITQSCFKHLCALVTTKKESF